MIFFEFLNAQTLTPRKITTDTFLNETNFAGQSAKWSVASKNAKSFVF